VRGCDSRYGLAQIGLGKGKPAIIPGNDSSGYSPGEDESLASRTTGSPCAHVARYNTAHTREPWSYLGYVKG